MVRLYDCVTEVNEPVKLSVVLLQHKNDFQLFFGILKEVEERNQFSRNSFSAKSRKKDLHLVSEAYQNPDDDLPLIPAEYIQTPTHGIPKLRNSMDNRSIDAYLDSIPLQDYKERASLILESSRGQDVEIRPTPRRSSIEENQDILKRINQLNQPNQAHENLRLTFNNIEGENNLLA